MPLKTIQDETPSINMTPMIDIVFLLIIFFMAGTRFTELERSLDLQVPRVSNLNSLSETPARKPINIAADGRIEFDRQLVDVPQLVARLRQARVDYPDLGIVIRGDENALHRYVASAMKACRDAGIHELSVAVSSQ